MAADEVPVCEGDLIGKTREPLRRGETVPCAPSRRARIGVVLARLRSQSQGR